MSEIKVEFAVYGALKHGISNSGKAMDVKTTLQNLIIQNKGVVTITNTYMGGDPCLGNTKQFGAQIQRDGATYYFACLEGQTIDFEHGGNLI
ncbi:hypothetical protein SAMN05421640_2745 [Ekhidna lutea]|uniref:Uncharacterized protein n=1 Tax=Ekhidna lutea TaxID=447679 RepID=A0A239KP09_EKHLU|nr:hypothetical protein [Ekhidna lutea]SNT18914.1 hypothetical protein SAMN05421640_2745 [Ekhidna lutea]